MDKTNLVEKVSHLFRISGYKVDISVNINYREIDVRAEETQGLVRKVILIECADYATPVGVRKLQEDIFKLRSAKEQLKDNAIVMHVSKHGYTQDASGYALKAGISIFSIRDLENQLVNFDSYIQAVESEQLRETILREYQPNKIQYERSPRSAQSSLKFLQTWLDSDERWLTLLGDYGVGKSWTLRRFLYALTQKYKDNPEDSLLPFFIPLQRFTKAFDFNNLILRTFQIYGLSGIHLSAFEYLMNQGRILFLLDSFDEMAQHLSRETIRENLKEILLGTSKESRAIMTSRPNYFEGRAERLLVIEKEGYAQLHALDKSYFIHQNTTSRIISEKLERSQFARIHDLSIDQRKELFRIVLGTDTPAYKRLIDLFNKFQELETISQRAVIARLLTTVAETLAFSTEVMTVEGYPLIPTELEHLNQAKVFEIVTYNLLHRDQIIGSLSAFQRLAFLRHLAIFLQRQGHSPFASPEEVRELVREIFENELRRTDTPEQMLENYYRTCRRHSGLTTEGQFLDSSGSIDFPVDELDTDSNIGFSHNSLREYLVADAVVDYVLNDTDYPRLSTIIATDLVGDFVVLKTEYDNTIISVLISKYLSCTESRLRELLFRIIYKFIHSDPQKHLPMLGQPPSILSIDLTGLDFSGMSLKNAEMTGCIIMETDFRKSDLRLVNFKGSIMEQVQLDGAQLEQSDFREAEITSIYVYDDYSARTTAMLTGKDARQWLYSRGALVHPSEDLNPLLGRPWYEAAREVTRTLEHRIAGSHQDTSLAKGTSLRHRKFAKQFVEFLVSHKILLKKKKSDTGPGWIVLVNPKFRNVIKSFSQDGAINKELEPFFKKHLSDEDSIDISQFALPKIEDTQF